MKKTQILSGIVAGLVCALPAQAVQSDYIGQAWFPQGDSIEITAVGRNENLLTVAGRYILVSHERATLRLYITTTNKNAGEGKSTPLEIARGRGDFALAYGPLVTGLPHVSMYPVQGGESFASLYFGTKEEAAEERRMKLGRESGGQRGGSSPTAAPLTLESAPPVVVKTVPVAGAAEVDPGLTEIRVTYSKAMLDGSWSWSTWGEENYPLTTGAPRYLEDHRTCALPVKLQPEKFYALWLNSDKYKGFQDASGQPAVPYLLTFTTANALPGSRGGRAFEHHVKLGDTLSRIVSVYREKGAEVTVDEVLKANPGLDFARLRVGQTIFIPRTHGTGSRSGADQDTVNSPIKTIVLTRATNQLVQSADNVRTVSVWTHSSLQPGEAFRARVRNPDGEMQNASSQLFVSWKKSGVSSSTSFSWFFKGAFGEKEAEAAVTQIQENKTEKPIRLASGEPLELFAVTNQQGGVMTGYVEFVRTDPAPAEPTGGVRAKVKALVRINRFTGFLPSLNYSAEIPPGYALRATASEGEANTHTPAGPYEYSSTWFQPPRLPGSPTEMKRWPEQRQAQQAAFQAHLQQLQEQGPLEVVLGEPRLLFSITNSPGDVFQGFLELVGPPAVTKRAGAAPDDFLPLLNDDQRAVLAWTDRQFRSFFDSRTFEGWSDEERANLEKKLIDALNGPRSGEYFQAINTLPALRSTAALPKLRAIAFERVDRNNRDRWMCIRALGIMGDKDSVPDLIHLVYHGNVNTRWWAQIALVQITGKNFAKDWNAWGKWWNDQHGSPPYKPEIIRWWDGQPEPDKLAGSLEESDRKFFESLKPKSAATPAPPSSAEVAAKLRNATPLMDGIRESWSSAVEAMQRADATSALASLRTLAPRIQELVNLMKGTTLEAGAAESLETLKSLMKSLEKGDKEATQTALAAMTALGKKMEQQVKAHTDTPGS